MSKPTTNSRLSFGLYEVDLHSGELWKAGFRVKLQGQPFKVLTALLEKPGHVVTRDELQARIWGKDTVVDFDHSLGTAINKIREALGDSADNPRFIETLARRGYRFIAPVGIVDPAPEVDGAKDLAASALSDPPVLYPNGLQTTDSTPLSVALTPHASVEPQTVERSIPPYPLILRAFMLAAVMAACTASFFVGKTRSATVPPHITQITHNGHLAPSIDSMEDLAAAVTDGVHLYAATLDSGHSVLSSVAITHGVVEPINIPAEVASPALGDISPDGSSLLLRDHLSPESEQPLWVVPTSGGSALRVGAVLAHDATWMPDGENILYANGNDLYLTQRGGQQPTHYASLPGRAFWLRWSPNGSMLRFTVLDPLSHTMSLWQITPSDRVSHRLLSGFNQPSSECCGVWTADGSAFVFQSSKGGNDNLWMLHGSSDGSPRRLTDGPLDFESPVAARSGSRIFFMGADARSELESLTPAGDLTAVKGFLASAVRVDYSHDGKWVLWTDTAGQLWRARSDGSEKLQITPESLYVFFARWSPDGSHIVAMAREAGKAWQIFVTSADGGDLRPLLQQKGNAADPTWSPDGKSVVFGGTNDVMGKDSSSRMLQIVQLASGKVQPVPGSNGLFSPRWSPDGRYIAALSLDQQKVRLYTVATQSWATLNLSSGADPIWSADSHYLFVHASLDPAQPIDRVTIPDGHVDEIARLAQSRRNDAVDFVFGGLTPTNQPLIRARVFTGNFYSLDLK